MLISLCMPCHSPLPSLALTSFYNTIKQSLGPYLAIYTLHNLASALYLALGRIKPKDLFLWCHDVCPVTPLSLPLLLLPSTIP